MSNNRMLAPGERVIKQVELGDIVTSHNPRKPLKKLQGEGFEPLDLCHDFGLSDDVEKRQYFCKLIEENETHIVELAHSLTTLDMGVRMGSKLRKDQRVGQIQAVVLRDFRTLVGTEYETRYGIAAGERRYIATVYIQAKTGVTQKIDADVRKLTVLQAKQLGRQENMQRVQMEEWEVGEQMNEWVGEQIDLCAGMSEDELLEAAKEKAEIAERNVPKDTSREKLLKFLKPNDDDVAREFHVAPRYAHGRMALAKDLPPERLALVKAGKLGITNAIKEALKEPSHVPTLGQQGHRHVAMTLKDMRQFFDETQRSNLIVLQTIARCMKMSYDEAIQESNMRKESRAIVNEMAETRQALTGT